MCRRQALRRARGKGRRFGVAVLAPFGQLLRWKDIGRQELARGRPRDIGLPLHWSQTMRHLYQADQRALKSRPFAVGKMDAGRLTHISSSAQALVVDDMSSA